MYVVGETDERTTTTAAATMFGLAAPSQGSKEVSTWRVQISDAVSTPVHSIDKEQVWMPIEGSLEVSVDDVTEKFSAGQAAVIPAGALRKVTAVGGNAQALVAMAVGGKAGMPGGGSSIPLPWAE